MLKAGFFLIAFIIYSGAWSASVKVKDTKKLCERDKCIELSYESLEAKKFDESLKYASIVCLGDDLGNSTSSKDCSLVFTLGLMDVNLLDKARKILKQRYETKNIHSAEDSVNLGILEQKKGNILVADKLFKEACNSPKNCATTAGMLILEQEGKAVEFLRKCDALGGHPSCLLHLAGILFKKGDCIREGKLLERACEFQKKDPGACQKWSIYAVLEVPILFKKCIERGGSNISCNQVYIDGYNSTLNEACEVQEVSVQACVDLLIPHMKNHIDHKGFVSKCAQGDNSSCNHLAIYLELNDPERAKKIKCGFGIFEGCGKIK